MRGSQQTVDDAERERVLLSALAHVEGSARRIIAQRFVPPRKERAG